ncbi:MAG: peptide methionine sulfoxide reductase [Bacteroidota bacterium]
MKPDSSHSSIPHLKGIILNIPQGYSEVQYQGKTYSLTRSDFNKGKSLKIFAEELGGTDFISFNYYLTQEKDYLKPCEMPDQKVIDFLIGHSLC